MSDWVHAGLLYGILLVLCTPFPARLAVFDTNDLPAFCSLVTRKMMTTIWGIGDPAAFSLPVTEQSSTARQLRGIAAHPRGSMLTGRLLDSHLTLQV